MSERPRCQTCPFWNPEWDEAIANGELDPDFDESGDIPIKECRRFPSSRARIDSFRGAGRDEQASDLLKRGHGAEAMWLMTRADDWCGEHPDFPAYLAATRPKPEPAE